MNVDQTGEQKEPPGVKLRPIRRADFRIAIPADGDVPLLKAGAVRAQDAGAANQKVHFYRMNECEVSCPLPRTSSFVPSNSGLTYFSYQRISFSSSTATRAA